MQQRVAQPVAATAGNSATSLNGFNGQAVKLTMTKAGWQTLLSCPATTLSAYFSAASNKGKNRALTQLLLTAPNSSRLNIAPGSGTAAVLNVQFNGKSLKPGASANSGTSTSGLSVQLAKNGKTLTTVATTSDGSKLSLRVTLKGKLVAQRSLSATITHTGMLSDPHIGLLANTLRSAHNSFVRGLDTGR